MIILYVTHPTEEHAVSILKTLIEEQLVACGNVYPIRSIYPWEGKVCDETEYVSILKSTLTKKDLITKRVIELHEYDVPCVLTINAEANHSYSNWILNCLNITP